jgi:hypothetical protein
MIIHKDCSALSIFAFNEITKTQDLRWLLKDFDENDCNKLELTDEQKIELSEVFSNIFYEYGELTSNLKITSGYKKRIQIKYLENKYDICKKIISIYNESQLIEVVELLNEFKYKIDIKKELAPQIEVVVDSLNALETEIKILKINYKNQFGTKSEIEYNLDKEAFQLEMNLKLNYSIDVKKTSVKRWVTMMNVSNEKMKHYGKT